MNYKIPRRRCADLWPETARQYDSRSARDRRANCAGLLYLSRGFRENRLHFAEFVTDDGAAENELMPYRADLHRPCAGDVGEGCDRDKFDDNWSHTGPRGLVRALQLPLLLYDHDSFVEAKRFEKLRHEPIRRRRIGF
jgi:hypothetical protein